MLPRLKPRQRTITITMFILILIWLLLFGRQLYQAGLQLFDTPVPATPGEPWLLQALDVYGLPLLFGLVMIAAAGIPFPISWLLLALGGAAAQGELSIAWLVTVAVVAAVLGDHLGYLIGWIGGRWFVRRIARLLKREEQIRRAQDTVRRRGWMAVFLSRWLVLPLGSPCNWICGSLGYPLRRFFVADVLGELLYVGLCVVLGVMFHEQIEGIAGLMSRAGVWMVGLVVALLLGARLLPRARTSEALVEPPLADDRVEQRYKESGGTTG
jgi:membrane protein DedA with SNARE-associated domain